MLNQVARSLIVFYYHYLCRLSGHFSFLIPFLCTVRFTLKAYDLASDWSLVVDPYIFSLVTCRVACCTMCGGGSSFLFHVSRVAMQVTGHLRLVPMQLYWSLAWSLVSNPGFLGKSYPGEVATASSSDLSKRLVACSIFNASQGGRLSHCHHIIMYMYFLLWIFVS